MEKFERLLRAHYGPLERFVKYRLSGTGDAEDLLQEVCLTAYEKYHTLRDPAKFKPWILQIARNKCLNYFRAKRPEHISLDTVELCLTDSFRGPVEAVQDTLSLMREQDRAVLTLAYFDGLSQTEIAGRLQIPVGTVKSRMYAAKNRFRSIYPTASKGNDPMKNLPNIMPEYTITRSAEAPFPVKWEELMGWFIVPREGRRASGPCMNSRPESAPCMWTWRCRGKQGYMELMVCGFTGKAHSAHGVFHRMGVLHAFQLILERLRVGVILGFPVRCRLLDALNVHVLVGLDCGIGVTELGFQAVPLSGQGGDGVLHFGLGLAVLCHDLLNEIVRQVSAAADIQIFEIVAFHSVLLCLLR